MIIELGYFEDPTPPDGGDTLFDAFASGPLMETTLALSLAFG
jgi:hypothetical protein